MKKTKNCGFTLIELVIVIAVIAILSAVLIPTFGGMIESARNSSRDQKAKNAYTDYFAHHPTDDNSYLIIEVEDGGTKYHYNVINGQIDLEGESKALSESYKGGTQYNGYVVYPASVGGFLQAKWAAMVTYETAKPKQVKIGSDAWFSSLMVPRYKTLDSEDIPAFIRFLRESDISFGEFNVTSDDRSVLTTSYYYVVDMAYYSEDDNNRTIDEVVLHFVIGENGYIYFDCGKFGTSSILNKKTVIRSTKRIDFDRIIEFYNQAKSN